MQGALYLPPPLLPVAIPTKNLVLPWKTSKRVQIPRYSKIKASSPGTTNDTSAVDYSSATSVFPAEACETIGGEACDVEMYPEVKLKPDPKGDRVSNKALEQTERDYLQYNSPKTVFPGEACDDLGGEFCEAEYQEGVY